MTGNRKLSVQPLLLTWVRDWSPDNWPNIELARMGCQAFLCEIIKLPIRRRDGRCVARHAPVRGAIQADPLFALRYE